MLSDTHNQHQVYTGFINNSGADMILHAGDVSGRGSIYEVQDFLEWFAGLEIPNKIFIAGNHDFLFEDSPTQAAELIEKYHLDILYLHHSEITIEGLKIFGSPYSPRFFDWAFNVDRGQPIRDLWLQIPTDADIVITHGPVAGIHDYVRNGKRHNPTDNVGCEDLLDIITTQVNPIIHLCGHIHNQNGYLEKDGIHFFNASVLDDYYDPVNDPYVIELYKNNRMVQIIR